MPNTREELVNRFVAFSGVGKVQSAIGVGQPNGDIDTRDKCTITREEVFTRRDVRDCRNQDLTDSQIITRLARYTLVYAEITPQLYARWFAYFAGASAAPTGTPADEVQTLAVVGDGTLALTLEGRTATTKTIPAAGITAAKIQAALTASRMFFIHPGDVVVSGGSSPFTLTFPNTGRLGRANLPLVVGTGGFTVSASADGAQKYHAFTRSVSQIKKRFSFVLGYEDNTGTLEKHADFVCETFQPTASLSADPGLTVTILGPWDYDSLEPTFTVPDCINPVPLRTEDCKLEVDGVFQTPDLNSLTNNLNDNVPIDRLSAFAYDSMEVQTLIRGRQPSYSSSASIFGISDAAVYALAQNERTQAPVTIIQHFGLPGNRFTLIYINAKVRFQNNREAFVGTAETSAINLEFIPLVNGLNPPINGEAYIAQTVQFLTSS
jgi:hypothetical protein